MSTPRTHAENIAIIEAAVREGGGGGIERVWLWPIEDWTPRLTTEAVASLARALSEQRAAVAAYDQLAAHAETLVECVETSRPGETFDCVWSHARGIGLALKKIEATIPPPARVEPPDPGARAGGP